MERIKLTFAGLVVLALLVVAWRTAARSLMSPEELIRFRLEKMVDGFEDRVVRRVNSGFDEYYRDEETGYGREEVTEALQALFFQSFGAEGGRYRLEIPEAELVVTVAESGSEARVSLRAVFYRERRGEEKLWWDAHAVLDWRRFDRRWLIVRSSEVNHRDRSR